MSIQYHMGLTFFFVVVVVVLFLTLVKGSVIPRPPSQQLVVVTGCDTGFGLLASSALSQAGYPVIAACLTKEGCQRLSNVNNIQPVLCDVTCDNDVKGLARATETLLSTNADMRLWALVNNAGIAPLGNMDWMSMESTRKVMEVNYFGLVSVTKAHLPLLKRIRNSRIINISSVAGLAGLPMFGAYSASKHAVEGFSKCLRLELRPWGIHVAGIHPAFMKTPMVIESAPKMLTEFMAAEENIRTLYPTVEEKLTKAASNPLELGEDPQVVVDQILALVRAENPALVNFTGSQAKMLKFFLMLPTIIQEYFLNKIDIYSPSNEILDRFQSSNSNSRE